MFSEHGVVRLAGHVIAISMLTVASFANLTGRAAGPAAADDLVPLGGGAGIMVAGNPCTLATIGHDRSNALIGITASTCGGSGSPVAAEGSSVTAGTVTGVNADVGYAVIKFDPAEVTPTANIAGFEINGLGPDLRQIELQTACHQSRATGRACAQIFAGKTQTLYECGNPDDAGAPLTVNDALVGMILGGFTPSDRACPEIHGALAPHPYFPKADQPRIASIDTILGDINAKGGPGAGFSPIPA